MLGASGGGSGAMPNVIKYYGSLMEGPRVWIIMECAEGGSIRTLVSEVTKTTLNSVSSSTPQRAAHLSDHPGSAGSFGFSA